MGSQPVVSIQQVLREYSQLMDSGHKIGIPFPPRKNMSMQMILYSGTGTSPNIDAKVQPSWIILLPENLLTTSEKVHHLAEHFWILGDQGPTMRVRDHHHMGTGVGERIQDYITRGGSEKNQTLPVHPCPGKIA